MANHLVRITDKDYRDYRRSYSRIVYSINQKGKPPVVSEETVNELSNSLLGGGIMGKGDFLDMMDQPEKYALYFLKNDDEQIIGVLSLLFREKSCYIGEFAVFERGKGLGTELYALTLEEIALRNVKLIELSSPPPFAGAREFWKKKGFTLKHGSDSVFEKRVKFHYKK